MRWRISTELMAGAISAVVMLPQAVVLATLAGMPPEHGIYASVFPAIVAIICGSSRLVLTGPNTTIALMAGSLVASIVALNSPSYVALMLFISLLTGLIQLGFGFSRGTALLRFLPANALSGVTSAVGVTILLSQVSTVTGKLYLYDDQAWVNAVRCLMEPGSWDLGAVVTGLATLGGAMAAGSRSGAKFAMPLAMACGTVAAMLWTTLTGRTVEMLGHLDLSVLTPSGPMLLSEHLPYLGQIVLVAVSIAVIGLLQTAVIARSLHNLDTGRFDLGREIRGQGLANVCAAFTSGMPVSGSFNRSAAHVSAGACTRFSGIVASILLLLAARYCSAVVSYLPLPVMGGVLVHIGWKLIDKAEFRAIVHKFDRSSGLFFIITLCGVFFGITAAVLLAASLSIAAYLRYSATPRIWTDKEDARFERTLNFEGDLFFGSAQTLEDALHEVKTALISAKGVKVVLHTTYIDQDGRDMLEREYKRWSDAGDVLHIVQEGAAASAAKATRAERV